MKKSERTTQKSMPTSLREERARARRENREVAERMRESKKKGKTKGGDDVVVGEDDVVEVEDSVEGEEPTVKGSERLTCDGFERGDNASVGGGNDGPVRSGDDDDASVRPDSSNRVDGGSVKREENSWKMTYEMWANESDPDDVDFVGERVDGTSEHGSFEEDEGVGQKRKRDVSEDEEEGVGMNKETKIKKGNVKKGKKKKTANRKVKAEPEPEPEEESKQVEESESEDKEDLLKRFEYDVEEEVARFELVFGTTKHCNLPKHVLALTWLFCWH